MEIKGLKQIKSGAKLFLKKQKLEEQLKQLAKEYHQQVSVKAEDETYFIAMVEDYIKQSK